MAAYRHKNNKRRTGKIQQGNGRHGKGQRTIVAEKFAHKNQQCAGDAAALAPVDRPGRRAAFPCNAKGQPQQRGKDLTPGQADPKQHNAAQSRRNPPESRPAAARRKSRRREQQCKHKRKPDLGH